MKKDDEVAEPGEYSDSDNYKNITPMKHDIFKQLTTDAIILFIIFIFIRIFGESSKYFKWSDFISFKNFHKFRLSIVGQSLISMMGYVVYFQIVQPYIVNRIKKF